MNNYLSAFSSFSVSDVAASKEFYATVLGLDVSETKMGLEIKLKGGGSVFLYGKSDHMPATYTTLNFVVNDINVAVDELTAKGVVFEKYDGVIKTDERGIARGKHEGMGPDIAWFKDPSGNYLAIIED